MAEYYVRTRVLESLPLDVTILCKKEGFGVFTSGVARELLPVVKMVLWLRRSYGCDGPVVDIASMA